MWVVRHAWHTAVGVRRADVDTALWPEIRELGDVQYVEVGWGDRDFYPDPDPSLWDAIDTVIRPTPAALYVSGSDGPPTALSDEWVVRIDVRTEGFARLIRFIQGYYVHDAAGATVRLRPGPSPPGWFYAATGRYHALHNSNRWTASALREAGVPMNVGVAFTAGNVMRQTARQRDRLRRNGHAGDLFKPKGDGRRFAPAERVEPAMQARASKDLGGQR